MRFRRRELLLLVLFIMFVTLSLAQACCKRKGLILRQKHLYIKTKRRGKYGCSPAQQMLKERLGPKEGEVLKRPPSAAVTKLHPVGYKPPFLRPHIRRVTRIGRPSEEKSPAQRSALAAMFSPKQILPEKKPVKIICPKTNQSKSSSPSIKSTNKKKARSAPYLQHSSGSYAQYPDMNIVIVKQAVSLNGRKNPTVSPSSSKRPTTSPSSSKSPTVSRSGNKTLTVSPSGLKSFLVPGYSPFIIIKQFMCKEKGKQRECKSFGAQSTGGSRETVRIPLKPKSKSHPALLSKLFDS